MARYGEIIPMCLLLASGCALLDDREPATETPTVSAAVMEQQEPARPAPAVQLIDPYPIQPSPPAPRALTRDEVRHLQTRLRDLGLDPGPIDGVLGPRTRAALARLHTGCAKVSPLIESLRPQPAEAQGGSGDIERKLPGRNETRQLQSELRAAGFDPGPVDGIFGRRTRLITDQLRSGCIVAKKSAPMLLDLSSSPVKEGRAATLSAPALAPAPGSRSPETAHGLPKVAGSRIPPRPREDVRILQLRLRDAGFDPGPFDGIMGPKTRAALAQYEASQRIGKIKTGLIEPISGEQY